MKLELRKCTVCNKPGYYHEECIEILKNRIKSKL